jgi:hypothetical protein
MPVSNRRPPRWTGWYRRPGGQWRPLVSGGDEDGAWRALLDAVDRAGCSCDLAVLPAAEQPKH